MTAAGAGLTARRAAQSVTSAINRAAGGRPIPGNQVTPLIDGPFAYDAMIAVIAAATRWIHFENYIIRADSVGLRFAEALAARAREGLHVRVLYDALGCFGTPRSFWRELRRAGAEVRPFRPLSPLDLVPNLSRNHRKLVVADGARAVMGGLCIGREWTGEGTRDGQPWRDTAVEIAGPAAAVLDQAFARTWAVAGGGRCPTSTWPAGSRRRARPKSASSAASPAASVPIGSSSSWPPARSSACGSRTRIWWPRRGCSRRSATPPATGWTCGSWCPARAISRWCGTSRASATGSCSGAASASSSGTARCSTPRPAWPTGDGVRVGSSNLNPSSLVGNYELDVLIEDPALGDAMERQFRLDIARSREVTRRPARGPQRISAALPSVLTPRGARSPGIATSPDRPGAAPACRAGGPFPHQHRPPLDLPAAQRDPDLPRRHVLRPAQAHGLCLRRPVRLARAERVAGGVPETGGSVRAGGRPPALCDPQPR